MGSYNAAVDMVDRNVAEGRGSKIAFIDPARRLTYGELADSVRARRPDARNARTAARRPRRDDHAGHGRFPGAVLGRDPRRHHSDPAQHAAAGRAVPLHPAGFARQGAVRVGAVSESRRGRDRRDRDAEDADRGRRRPGRASEFRRTAASRKPRRARPKHAATRSRSGSTRPVRPACRRACGTCIRAREKPRSSTRSRCSASPRATCASRPASSITPMGSATA